LLDHGRNSHFGSQRRRRGVDVVSAAGRGHERQQQYGGKTKLAILKIQNSANSSAHFHPHPEVVYFGFFQSC
jgi:hypothetical protein